MNREHLPATRCGVTHTFTIYAKPDSVTVTIRIGLYPDGRPGELFIDVEKEGSTLSGLFDCFGITVSLLLQDGHDLKHLVNKFNRVRFEPAGMTDNPDIPNALSIPDYIVRWMERRFIGDKS